MVVASQYQFKLLVDRSWRAREGTLAMAMTSLKDMIWMTVMMRMTYMWPMKRAAKKPPIMSSVHIVLVMKFCFFFS